MTIEKLIIYGKQYLSSTEAKMILSMVLGYDSLDLLNHLGEIIEDSKVGEYKKIIDAKLNNKPIQYILGKSNFYGLDLIVNENVLIPRFETEELVENTKEMIDEKFGSNAKILDLCCGSGAIALALKNLNKNYDVTMSDISQGALEVAKENSRRLNLDVKAIQSDLFANIDTKYDVIVSNPPYIKTNEEIEDIVRNNEPHLALYAGEDGLDFYRRIFKEIKKYLNDKYLIAIEIGCTQKEEIFKLINENLENVDIICKKDLSNRDRMIFITSK